jgi:hypothetical protein
MIENPYYLDSPDDSPKQTINEKLCDGTILIGYGKVGHGMNGKDADLDRVGQCLVTELETQDPIGAKEMRIAISLRLYATICCPSYDSLDFYREKMSDETRQALSGTLDVDDDKDFLEYLREQATMVVCGMHHDVGGNIEWDEDSQWSGGINVTLYVPLSVDEYEEIEDGNEETLKTIAQRISTEICEANQGGSKGRELLKLWEHEIGMVNDMINDLP